MSNMSWDKSSDTCRAVKATDDNVSSVCTWFYVAAQMTQSADNVHETLLSHIISVELRPTWILQYLSE